MVACLVCCGGGLAGAATVGRDGALAPPPPLPLD